MQNFIVNFTKMDKYFVKSCHQALASYNLTEGEVMCLMFLRNNYPFDRAKDIVEYRKISKSLVSISVDSLVKKGLLAAKRDERDNRVIHLQLTGNCSEVARILDRERERFNEKIQKDLTEEELALLEGISRKMVKNLEEMS